MTERLYNLKNNRLVKAVLYSILTSALFHIFLMGIYAVFSGDFETVNVFHVLGISLFFPEIKTGPLSFVLSYIVFGSILLTWYLILKRSGQSKRHS